MKRISIILTSIVTALSSFALTSTTGTITTPKGSSIEVVYYIESSSEKSSLNDVSNTYITENFPNVTIIAEASYTYNCHGYAWSKSEGGNTCWINYRNSSSGENLSKFWTDGSYNTIAETYALKIHYPSGDHSAIRTYQYPGKYVSKWGAYHLVVHDPGYGPYTNMSNRNYYRTGRKSGLISCSNGQGTIGVGDSYTYWNRTFSAGSGNTFKWIIWDPKGNDAIENGKANISITYNKNEATISYNNTGIYEIYLYVYDFTGYQTGEYWCEAIVIDE